MTDLQFIKTMIEEKGIMHLDFTVEVEGVNHDTSVQVFMEFMDDLPQRHIEKIKHKFSIIDFNNGDLMHFIKYLMVGMIQMINEGQEYVWLN